ncbi:pectate lyase superfamily protein-domain-containing protein [Mycena sp. CBHHK59/15]|nr:pectate lyase superfamily protein-domain-containing protein [Mycena sp. CBHHK59/15]
MLSLFLASKIATVISYAALVYSLGTTCTTPIGRGTAAPASPFWMQNIKHQGIAAFNPNSTTYQVFRNVKDFCAKGDGITDDTVAIKYVGATLCAAISAGNRCGGGLCPSSTTTPAVVFFPLGKYVISAPIIAYYYTQLIGDANFPPTLLAAPNFGGIAVIDADPYIATGQFYDNTNNFFRSVRNFTIDLTQIPATSSAGTGIHWQVAQAKSLMNIVINMSADPNTAHQGLVMENGRKNWNVGRKPTLGIGQLKVFDPLSPPTYSSYKGWTFQAVTFNNCSIGFDISTGGGPPQPVAAEAIIDATALNTLSSSGPPPTVRRRSACWWNDDNYLMGPAGGAIVVEWNVKQTTQGGAGMWDSHIRLGGGTVWFQLKVSCSDRNSKLPERISKPRFAHRTEVVGTWVWLADHDLDEPGGGQDQVSIYSARGILSESAGPVWLIGTASEHHVLYQYNLANAKSHYMGLIQTETPYFQPNPVAPVPFTVNTAFKDPASWSDISQAWGLWVTSSDDILVFGAALYSFYSNYDQGCLTPVNCQSQIVNVDNESSVDIYSLSTIGTTWQLSINQVPLINQDQNLNGFASTVTSWSSS